MNRDPTDERRRWVLKLAGAAAVAGLAGCSSTQRFTAGPVALDGEGPSARYELTESGQSTRTLSPDAVDAELTLVSHAAAYRREGQGFLSDVGVGLLATPRPTRPDRRSTRWRPGRSAIW